MLSIDVFQVLPIYSNIQLIPMDYILCYTEYDFKLNMLQILFIIVFKQPIQTFQQKSSCADVKS